MNNNNSIESFIIKKIYPNLILIDLKKTKFIGITAKNNKNFFIGSNGKLIRYKKIIQSCLLYLEILKILNF